MGMDGALYAMTMYLLIVNSDVKIPGLIDYNTSVTQLEFAATILSLRTFLLWLNFDNYVFDFHLFFAALFSGWLFATTTIFLSA